MTNPQALEALRFAKQCLMSEQATGQPLLQVYLDAALEKINAALAPQPEAQASPAPAPLSEKPAVKTFIYGDSITDYYKGSLRHRSVHYDPPLEVKAKKEGD